MQEISVLVILLLIVYTAVSYTHLETRPGLQVEETDKILQKVEAIVSADEDLESYMLTSGGSGMSLGGGGASLTAYLKDDRKRETDEVVKEWKPLMNQVIGANITLEASSSMSMMSTSGGVEYISVSYTHLDVYKRQGGGDGCGKGSAHPFLYHAASGRLQYGA